MYSPAIINPEQAFQPSPFGKDRLNLVLPLHSFSEGDPFLVEIPPYSGFGPMDLNAAAKEPSLILDTTLSAQTSPTPASFGASLTLKRGTEDGSRSL